MKTLHVFLFLFFILNTALAQLDKSVAQIGLTGKMNYNYETQGTHSQFGMELLMPVGEKINLHYGFSMGTNEKQKYAAYTSLGMYVGGWVTEKATRNTAGTVEWVSLFFIITLLIPEGVSAHIPLNQSKTIYLTPYLKPLGTDYNLYNDFRWNYCASAGTRIGIFASKNVMIAPEIGIKYTAQHPSGTGGRTNFFAGVGVWLQTKGN
jgi:hypothetical protein